METIRQAVGIRNGGTMMPNEPADLRTITGLLDRIPSERGGTADIPGSWSSDRAALIAEVTAAIVSFQTVNNRPVIDGVVDPGGGTLRQLNQLAGAAPIVATVAGEGTAAQYWTVADPTSLNGTGPLRPLGIQPPTVQKIVSVAGTSIRWFGVVVPLAAGGGIIGGEPHIFFTPTPWQHQPPCLDAQYEEFSQPWLDLANKYTSLIGSQLIVSRARQVLVIPFYKNAQAGNLGSFLDDWKEVVAAAVGAAIDAIDPLFLRDTYAFDKIFTSSFSNGIVAHQNFHTYGADAADRTRMAFNLDGQASGDLWNPRRAVVYLNRAAPNGINPHGTNWYVGGRFAEIRTHYVGGTDHGLCPMLLLHGLSLFANVT